MIRIRFFDSTDACVYESPVFSATAPRLLSKSGEWSAKVPLSTTLYDLLLTDLRAELWYDDLYIIGGTVQKLPIKYDADTDIEVRGREELDSLYDEPADSSLYINNKLFILQLWSLLEKSGWRLGLYQDIDRTKLITIDLRKEKQRLTLISTLLKLAPDLKYRFGGFDVDGQPMLDVSTFEDAAIHQVLPPSPVQQVNDLVIQDVQSTDDFTVRIWGLEPIGGDMLDNAGVKRAVRLSDLVNFTTLRFDIDFPVYEQQSELSYIVIPTFEGAVGGRVLSIPATTSGVSVIGEVGTGTSNRWATFIFHPIPGALTECSFWLLSVVASLLSNQGVNPFLWELREVDEANILNVTANALLGNGVIPEGTWGANQRVRVVFLTPMTVVAGKRYMFRVGFGTQPATSALAQVRVNVTNASKSFRLDYMNVGGSATNTAANYQPVFEAVTAPIDPRIGRFATEYQTKFVPQKEATNAALADIQNAALAMYEWGKIYLRNRRYNRRDLAVNLIGFRRDIHPGDVMQVLAQLQFPEGTRAAWEERTIESVEYGFTDQMAKTTIKFLPNIKDEEETNETIALYDEQKKRETTPEGKIFEPLWGWELTELTSVVQFKVPDTILSDNVTPAVTVIIPFAAIPAGKFESQLMGTPYAIHSNTAVPTVVEVVSKSSTEVTCRLAIRNVGWSLYDQATVYCHQVWR